MTDYRINLAKTFTSTPEERKKFYNGMLIYLVCCAAGLVFIAYFGSMNILHGIQASKQRTMLLKTVSSASDLSRSFYEDPQQVYEQLELYVKDLTLLQNALGRRSHFLPVVSQLFVGLPENVVLQDLKASAATKTISFSLVLPLFGQEGDDPVRGIQSVWNENQELMGRVQVIRPTTGQRRVVDGQTVFFVQFECILKR